MADQMDDDEVFDFSNAEFTRDDLVTALNDMVKEYRKLSRSFEEVKAENTSLQNSSTESSSVQLEDVDSLKTELSRLTAENELLRRHFAAECNRPNKDDRYRRDEKKEDRYKKEERYNRDDKEDDERTVERSKDKSKDKFKDRSKDRQMKTSSNKRLSRKHDRKLLVAEESTKSWADTVSDSSSSSSSSSDSEQEEVHCFMAEQMDDDEVLIFPTLNLHVMTLSLH
ncbi:hypothetical protein F511_29851 [Dorcoceras hygrometricum]|uniref:Uncharacterized protein n=1 Tax=Dorcoceras hygrometricum TaxID=472368 RepID=A0A2Z7BHJ1_9LAMI|nr:hypothetical protein F511_29851 [Dorcoceras hygrometricum]